MTYFLVTSCVRLHDYWNCTSELNPRSYLASLRGIKELTKNAKHAVNQASINQTDVANSLIPLPSLEEQQLIVDELESKLTICDNVEETIKLSLQQAETLRQSILKKTFEGKLV